MIYTTTFTTDINWNTTQKPYWFKVGLKYARKKINVQTLYKDINRIQLLLAVLYAAYRIVNLGSEH